MTFSRKSSKKQSKNKILYLTFFLVALLFILNIFQIKFFSRATHFLFIPINNLSTIIASPVKSVFTSKKDLQNENDKLKEEVKELSSAKLSYDALQESYSILLREFNRESKQESEKVANVIGRPPQSPYDTIIIDLGSGAVNAGDLVLSYGVPIGTIKETYFNTSNVELLSQPERVTVGFVGATTTAEFIGQGGGVLKTLIPKNIYIEKGDVILVPGYFNMPIGRVEEIITSDAESFQEIMTRIPISIYDIRIVTVLPQIVNTP